MVTVLLKIDLSIFIILFDLFNLWLYRIIIPIIPQIFVGQYIQLEKSVQTTYFASHNLLKKIKYDSSYSSTHLNLKNSYEHLHVKLSLETNINHSLMKALKKRVILLKVKSTWNENEMKVKLLYIPLFK